jgi:hypothetical protein
MSGHPASNVRRTYAPTQARTIRSASSSPNPALRSVASARLTGGGSLVDMVGLLIATIVHPG